MNGLGQELKGAYLLQRSRLFDATVEVEATEARHRAERAAREERDHEARSALLAIQSATRSLEASYDDLSREAQASLRKALAAEVELLRQLVETGHTSSRSAPFDVVDAIAWSSCASGPPGST